MNLSDAGVSRARLTGLRALYGFMVIGQMVFIWPTFFARAPMLAHFHGVVLAMLIAMTLLCALGLRYPLQMLPVLLWEMLWKGVWLSAIALPRWLSGSFDAATRQTVIDCVALVLVFAAVPWGYGWRTYVRQPAERAAPRPAPQ